MHLNARLDEEVFESLEYCLIGSQYIQSLSALRLLSRTVFKLKAIIILSFAYRLHCIAFRLGIIGLN